MGLAVAAAFGAPTARAEDGAPSPDPGAKTEAGQAPPSAGPSGEGRVARAQALFEEGRALLQQGDVPAACERLAESERLEPTVGTLGLLAACHEEQGRIATAFREYVATADRARDARDEREAVARQQAAALEVRVPSLSIAVRSVAPGLEVTVDGERLLPERFEHPLPVDPGPHAIVASAPGRARFHVRVRLEEGARTAVEVPELAPTEPPAPAPGPPPIRPAEPVARPDRGVSPRFAIALASGGLGAIGLGMGVGLAASALGKNAGSEAIHDTCTSAAQCAEGKRLRDEAAREATIATTAFVAGVAGLGAGIVLLVTSPRDRATPSGEHAARAATCSSCAKGKKCSNDADCATGSCQAGVCGDAPTDPCAERPLPDADPTCADCTQNGLETDVDCGGDSCPPCAEAKACKHAGDCQSGSCKEGICE